MDIIINKAFVNSYNGCDTDETFKIVAVDLIKDSITLQISKKINNEIWNTQRIKKYSDIKTQFDANQVKYV